MLLKTQGKKNKENKRKTKKNKENVKYGKFNKYFIDILLFTNEYNTYIIWNKVKYMV